MKRFKCICDPVLYKLSDIAWRFYDDDGPSDAATIDVLAEMQIGQLHTDGSGDTWERIE